MRAVCLIAALALAGAAQAGVEAYDTCLTDGHEARVMGIFFERFPHEDCEGPDCDPKLLESAIILARGQCRARALDACESAKCRLGLGERWRADGAELRRELEARIAELDLAALPALRARRFGNPALWISPHSCLGDATICESEAAGRALGDLERLFDEVMSVP
ncbi:MAG: hypothetical protein AAF647_08680 [Pseudomonadota bacterium]